MKKEIIPAIIVGTLLIAGVLVYRGAARRTTENIGTTAVVVDGKQIIDITARGGYSPRVINAQAGIETIIRVLTKDTYDCSVSLVIPKLKYQKFLSSSGTEEIIIPAAKANGTLSGLCSMGMYSFKVNFE